MAVLSFRDRGRSSQLCDGSGRQRGQLSRLIVQPATLTHCGAKRSLVTIVRPLSTRRAGAFVAAVGILLSLVHLGDALTLLGRPIPLLLELPPLVAAVVLVWLGGLLARGGVAGPDRGGRLLAWTGVGAVTLLLMGGWLFGAAISLDATVVAVVTPSLNLLTAGSLGGLVVGIYDLRGLDRQRSIAQLHRINDTLRIATQELLHHDDRADLEQAVCDRLGESDAYEAAWIGRYDETAERVAPTAWAGFPDEYFESIVVTVDDSPTGRGPGGRAIKTRSIQIVPDVFDEAAMEPWWDLLRSHGVESLTVVPIYHDDAVYGFISIYADRQNVFGEREQTALAELGEAIGHAVAAVETRAALARHEAELERQNERLEEFAGVVSHDLRNPLNAASGYLELAREGGHEGAFDRVADALGRMEALVDDLLALAKQGEAVDALETVSLEAVVDEAWATAGAERATLDVSGELGTVDCDRSRLRQLFENLLRNAVEHAEPAVTVTIRRTEDGFLVEDDGPGVPADERTAVFEAGHTTNAEGTGFGLNIVRTIAQAHGWSVTLEEGTEGGARFVFAGVEQSADGGAAP